MSHPSTNAPVASHDLLAESLRLLVFAHYVLAFVTALLAPVGLYMLFAGWSLLHPERGDAWTPRRGQEIFDPVVWGTVFYLAGGALATLSLVHAGLIAYIGRSIARRRRWRLCLVFSAFDLTYIPLGTALGVFALLLLLKPAVRDEFVRARNAELELRSA